MKQIKTIHHRIDESVQFDSEINTALVDGWRLTKREFVPGYCMLYAELEREIITEAERCCENCAHFDNHPDDEPCCGCEDGELAPTKWEAAE